MSLHRFLVGTVFSVALLTMGMINKCFATHLRAGEIVVERVNCQSLTFKITVTVYTNTASSVLFGGRAGEEDILDFGDGTWKLVPETLNTPRPDLGTNIGTASYTTFHTYSGSRSYIISYREPNRNEGVLNMDNSVNTRFYIETRINIDPFIGCNNSPKLGIPPIDQACTGVAFFHNPGAYDPDPNDSLSYELVIPYSDRNLPVVRYQDPSANTPRLFYTNYGQGNEDANGTPTFSIDPLDGTLKWDAPGLQGEYNVAFVVKEWRKVSGTWVNIGYVRRDMQILVNDCQNERPDLIMPDDLCVEAGTKITEVIKGIDPDNDHVKIEAFSDIFNFAPSQSPATYTPNDGQYRPSNPPYELHFEWNTECLHIKEQPYQIVFKITDNGTPKLVTFKTWRITVVGPKPEWQNPPAVNTLNKSVTLDWENYACSNADSIQIWRRVDSYPFTPAECETGMPPGLGYTLIDVVPNNNTTTYTDTNDGAGLAPGAKYCYRLVALFPQPAGGESYVSDEICIDPLPADAPVITNVTVDKTDQAAGEITIKWREPFDIPPGTYTQPYKYRVLRGVGASTQPTEVVNATLITSLTVKDQNLNTTDNAYNYAVICYDNNEVAIDTSFTASSVRLEAQSQLKRIELNWSALVPWSNSIAQYPMHQIYRGEEGATESQMVLIDSVNVTQTGFTYADEGQYNNVPLEDNKTYCYRVMTRGGYGNPNIAEPLINFSQIICAQPSDDVPPCQVGLPVAVDAPDCDNYTEACGQGIFQNKIQWERPNAGDCQNDVAYYNVYVAYVKGGTFSIYATGVKETFFEDNNLSSHAQCYKVSAVDRSGNEGPLSDPICIDNCPYYELPNIFTPNNDGCNDVFSAYNDRPIEGGGEAGSPCPIPPDIQAKCARFVEKVNFKVYNRWGKEVYSYESGGERTIYIDWNGRDNDGRELASAIYYYIAEVTFTTIDPNKRHQIIKGWVHLLR